jgi:hypothetical protein
VFLFRLGFRAVERVGKSVPRFDQLPMIIDRREDRIGLSGPCSFGRVYAWRAMVTGTWVGVRLQTGQIKAIDAWAAKQDPPVTRPEAIRGMIDAMLRILAKDPGEKPAK